MEPCIRYRSLRAEDGAQAVVLCKKCINAEDAFGDYILSLHARMGNGVEGVAALDGQGELVGVVYFTEGLTLSGGRTDFFPQIRQAAGNEPVWTANIIAVDAACRGLGVGRGLHEQGVVHLRALGVRHLLLEIWVRPDGFMPGAFSLRLTPSFTDYGTIQNYYAEAPEAAGHVCSVCGPHCKCAARIVVLHIQSGAR